MMPIYETDQYLKPYAQILESRRAKTIARLEDLKDTCGPMEKFSRAYEYYGMHHVGDRWILREWAPSATEIYVIGDFSGWKEDERYKMHRLEFGNWEVEVSDKVIRHGDKFKMSVHWIGGQGERIPAYIGRVVQNEQTKVFDAQAWDFKPFKWTDKNFKVGKEPRLIYEAMSA